MVINKTGKMVSNIGTPMIEFTTPESYTAWKNSLPSGVTEDDFLVVLAYTPEVGSYVQVTTKEVLEALTSEMKKEGVLYGVTEEKKLYHYNTTTKEFEPFS